MTTAAPSLLANSVTNTYKASVIDDDYTMNYDTATSTELDVPERVNYSTRGADVLVVQREDRYPGSQHNGSSEGSGCIASFVMKLEDQYTAAVRQLEVATRQCHQLEEENAVLKQRLLDKERKEKKATERSFFTRASVALAKSEVASLRMSTSKLLNEFRQLLNRENSAMMGAVQYYCQQSPGCRLEAVPVWHVFNPPATPPSLPGEDDGAREAASAGPSSGAVGEGTPNDGQALLFEELNAQKVPGVMGSEAAAGSTLNDFQSWAAAAVKGERWPPQSVSAADPLPASPHTSQAAVGSPHSRRSPTPADATIFSASAPIDRYGPDRSSGPQADLSEGSYCGGFRVSSVRSFYESATAGELGVEEDDPEDHTSSASAAVKSVPPLHSSSPAPLAAHTSSHVDLQDLQSQLATSKRRLIEVLHEKEVEQERCKRKIQQIQEVYQMREKTLREEVVLLRRINTSGSASVASSLKLESELELERDISASIGGVQRYARDEGTDSVVRGRDSRSTTLGTSHGKSQTSSRPPPESSEKGHQGVASKGGRDSLFLHTSQLMEKRVKKQVALSGRLSRGYLLNPGHALRGGYASHFLSIHSPDAFRPHTNQYYIAAAEELARKAKEGTSSVGPCVGAQQHNTILSPQKAQVVAQGLWAEEMLMERSLQKRGT